MNAARIARKDQIKLSEWKCSHHVKNPCTMQIEEKILNFQIEEKFFTFFSILMKISEDDIPTKTDMSDAILI